VEKFNNGTYKILIGSTACIGEGLNLQENSAALHHFDIPFRPSDFIQRNGRIDRQGNNQNSVDLHSYMSGGTIDNYSVSLVQRKANWIDQLLKTKSHVFVNPNDENFIDADELLLALTEEFGNADQAAARREEMNRVKEQKLAEAQVAQRKELLSQLSLLHGSLKAFEGDKGSPQYQNRIGKINIVEKALLSNPTVTEQHIKIVKKDTPFLYSKDTDQIVLKGDLFFSHGTPYEIVQLNFKKREFTGKPLREAKRNIYSPYDQGQNLNTEISVVKMKSAYNFSYYPEPSREDKKHIRLIDTKAFYGIEDEAFKERHYERHLEGCKHSDFAPVRFFNYREDGKLLIQDHDTYETGDDGNLVRPLNPFNEADMGKIKTAMNRGIDYGNSYREESCLETLGETLPEIRRLIEKTMTAAGEEVAEPDPLPKANIPENFRENLTDLAKQPRYRNDVMAAAQYLIRTAEPSDRERLKGKLVSLGCADPASTRKILAAWVQDPPEIRRSMAPPEPAMER
jgi:hypothetical protein